MTLTLHTAKKGDFMIKGVDYYPEQWPEEMLEKDLDRIVKLG